jgi:hypothetical protein
MVNFEESSTRKFWSSLEQKNNVVCLKTYLDSLRDIIPLKAEHFQTVLNLPQYLLKVLPISPSVLIDQIFDFGNLSVVLGNVILVATLFMKPCELCGFPTPFTYFGIIFVSGV